MGGHYDKSLYNELMEVMARLNSVEKETKQEISGLKNEVSDLKKENRKLREENVLFDPEYCRDIKTQEQESYGRHKTVISRNTGYFLAGVKSDGSAGRLNCYISFSCITNAMIKAFNILNSNLADPLAGIYITYS